MGYLIIILFILIGLIIVASVVRNVLRAVSSVGKTILGVTDLIGNLSDLSEESTHTPKSVSSMTRIYSPHIKRDFPDFHYHEMRERAESLLMSYFVAINNSNAALLTEGSKELKNQLRFHIKNNKTQKRKERFSALKIHQTEIADYQHTNGKVIITFQSAVGFCHYFTDKNEQVIQGNSQILRQTIYNVSVFYVQDPSHLSSKEKALGLTCPNCGAPVSSLGAKVCEYCDSPIVALNRHAWIFGEIVEK